MKHLLFVLMTALLLAACGNDSVKETEEIPVELDATVETEESEEEEMEQLEEAEEEVASADEAEKVEVPQGDLTVDGAKEIIETAGMGAQDKLVSATIEGEEIQAIIEMESRALMEDDFAAVASYSKASAELLAYEGWEVLTIEYVNVGTISMNRSEKEVNEDGMDHFPVYAIAGKLK